MLKNEVPTSAVDSASAADSDLESVPDLDFACAFK